MNQAQSRREDTTAALQQSSAVSLYKMRSNSAILVPLGSLGEGLVSPVA